MKDESFNVYSQTAIETASIETILSVEASLYFIVFICTA